MRRPLAITCLLACTVVRVQAAPLTPLLAGPSTTVTLDGGTVYTTDEQALATDKTIECNGATIQSRGGPIRISGAGRRLVIDDCRIDGTGWALLGALDGAELVVRNGTQLTGDGNNTAVYLEDATLDLTGGRIANGRWGVQMTNSDAALHGVVVEDTVWAVQNVAGAVSLDQDCRLSNLDPVSSGAGVSLIASPAHPGRGASAVIRGGTFTGFGNAVDIQPTAAQGLPPGTVDIEGATFQGAVYSALAAVDAVNVRVARTRVLDAVTDGIFFVNSTGVIEDTEVVGSLNTGVTFWGCPDGFTMRRSLVRDSAHQGVAVVGDPVNDRPSRGVRLFDNTLDGNAIANLLVDDRSDVLAHGNLAWGAPDMSVRFHGSPASRFQAGLLLDSHGGLEAKDGAEVHALLSVFTRHQRYGALLYAGGVGDFSHCAFEDNSQAPASDDHALVADTGARVTLARSAMGPAGDRVFYNNAGTASAAAHNFWSDPSGPALVGGGGAGALIGANGTNGSSIAVEPVLTDAPLEFRHEEALALVPDAPASWQPGLGIALVLTGAPGIPAGPAGRVAALRVHDASALTALAPPPGTGVLVTWLAWDVLARTQSGHLDVATTAAGTPRLFRLAEDGQWVDVAAAWLADAGTLRYAPADPRLLHGVFAYDAGTGCASARACLELLRTVPLCAEALNPKLEKLVAKKLRAALAKLARAVAAPKPAKAARLAAQARKCVQTIAGRAGAFVSAKKDPISPACGSAITQAVQPALQHLDAGVL